MQKIEKIYELFAEEAFGNSFECRIDDDIHVEGCAPIYLQKWDTLCPLFTINKRGTTITWRISQLLYDSKRLPI